MTKEELEAKVNYNPNKILKKIQLLKELKKDLKKLQTKSKQVQEGIKEELNIIRLNKIKEISVEYKKNQIELDLLSRKIRSFSFKSLPMDEKIVLRTEWRMISQYIYYLDSLLSEICELFGHDAKMIGYEHEEYKCNCCGQKFGYQDYINSHYNAKYRNVIDYYYEDDSGIIIEETSLPSVLSSPVLTLEEYKELTKAQFEKIKKSIGKEERDLVNNNEMEISGADYRKYCYKVSDYNSRAGSLKL